MNTPDLELAFTARGRLGDVITVGATPQGLRRMVPIIDGSFEGPRIRGEILPGGADWQVVRHDGVTEPEAFYLLRTDDGALIQVHNRGLRHGPDEVMQRLVAGEAVDPSEYYFRTTPVFHAPEGPYDWLNRNVFVCTAARQAATIELWVYRVT